MTQKTIKRGAALRRLRAGTALATGAAMLATALASAGYAQEAEEEDEEEVITVTGSRIARDAFSSESPVDVFTAEQAELQGVIDIGSLLQTATVASGSPQVTAASSSEFVQNGGIGASTLSLRGLGANRTLVLLNGRRAGPAGVRGGVSSFDLNVIPLSAIQRVEILKDGASSVYGSDAVAGVVNIITDKTDGGSVDAFYSQPFETGGEELRINGSYGQDFSRGFLRATADYYLQNELARGDRDYYSCGHAYVFDPATGERADVIDPRTGDFKCQDLLWGHIWTYDYAEDFSGSTNLGFGPPTLIQYDFLGDLADIGAQPLASDPSNPYWMTVPAGWYPANPNTREGLAYTDYDHPFQDTESLIPEIERYTLLLEGEFDIMGTMQAYGEALLNRRETYANGYRQYWTYLYNENFDFADVSPGVGDPMSAGWQGAQWLSPTPITDHADDSVSVDYVRFLGGLKGDFGGPFAGWAWDTSAQYSKSDGEYWGQIVFRDAIEDNWFRTGSCEGTTTSVGGAPCVDVDWLSPNLARGYPTPEERAFLFGDDIGTTEYTQLTWEGVITGELFTLPAGALGVAVGAAYQEDEIVDTPGPVTLAENVWNSTAAGVTAGEDKTKAVFAEAQIPILSGLPLVQEFSATVSGRYTEVDSYGEGDTYKVGLNWAVTDWLRFRATNGTSFRAPALFELYLSDQTSSLSQRAIDPCIGWGNALAAGTISQRVADNCAADGVPAAHNGSGPSATIITGGGLGVLDAETSEATTFGIILTPGFADLRFAIDYFEIEVNDEVDQLGAGNILFGCYDSTNFSTEALCDLFTRNPTSGTLPPNLVNTVRDSYININSQTNRGIDLTALYLTETPLGDLRVDSQFTIQLEDAIERFSGDVEELNGLVGDPEWTGEVNFTLDTGRFDFFYGVDLIAPSSNVDHYFDGNTRQRYAGGDVVYKLRAEFSTYHNASASYTFDAEETWLLRMGVSNLFDEQPPAVTSLNIGEYDVVGRSAFYSQFDPIGRRFFVNLSKTF